MDWSKLKMNEIKYYCTSFDIDFDCLPVSTQIQNIPGIFYYYGITAFEVEDIKDFYQTIQLHNPRSGNVVKPSPAQIQKALDKVNTVQCTSEDHYQILGANETPQYYSAKIKQVYASYSSHPSDL